MGYSLLYPRGWAIVGRAVATEFAAAAGCQGVRKVDYEPPPDAGPGAKVRQSLVQVCWKPLDGSTLDSFMESTYGARLPALFDHTRLAGLPAYRTAGSGTSATYFLQSDAFRLQLVTAVVADDAKEALRSGQVRRILSSLTLAH